MKALFSKESNIRWYELITVTVGFGLLVWFCIPFFFGVFNTGSYFGILISVLTIAYFPIKRLLRKTVKPKVDFIICSFIHFFVVIFAIWVTFLTGLMIFAVKQVPLANVTAVVLGNQVIGDEPSASLKSRLDKAVEFLKNNPNANCVVSGGMGTDEKSPEAVVMKNYLIKAGIAPERIEQETSSRNTKENLANSKKIINNKGWNKNIVIITEYYHQFRAGRLAKDLDLNYYSLCADTPWYIFSSSYGREIMALTKFFLHI